MSGPNRLYAMEDVKTTMSPCPGGCVPVPGWLGLYPGGFVPVPGWPWRWWHGEGMTVYDEA